MLYFTPSSEFRDLSCNVRHNYSDARDCTKVRYPEDKHLHLFSQPLLFHQRMGDNVVRGLETRAPA